MALAIWLCVLGLQASLLTHALECSGATQGEDCAGGRTADSVGVLGLQRRRRQLEWRSPAHLSPSSQPGAVTARGFPNTLIQQADRARRHLAASGNKKKNKRKSRVGSFSLISNLKPSAPLQISRARRQVKTEPPGRRKSTRSGAYSILGDPKVEGENDRPRRSVQRKRAAKNCS